MPVLSFPRGSHRLSRQTLRTDSIALSCPFAGKRPGRGLLCVAIAFRAKNQ